ncbi:MAG: hypothetical protein AAGA30_07340 [Planctomycetota bacterium]
MSILICCFSIGIVGCTGSQKPELVPASGVLLIDGEKAANIMVQFVPDTMDENLIAPTSQGLTNEEGEFDLYTLQNEKGAIEGPHRVSLIDIMEERVPQGQEASQPARLDPKFASGQISVTVKNGEKITLEANSPE